MSLSSQQLADFQRDGVIPLGRVLSDDKVVEAQHRLRALLNSGTFEDLYADNGNSDQPHQSHFRLNHVWQFDDWYKELLYKPELLSIVSSVLGPNVQLLHDQAFYKTGRDAARTHWHIDNDSWFLEPPNAASIWIALVDVDLDNACLYMLPGSHRKPPPLEEVVVDTGKVKGVALKFDESLLRPFPMPAGHALIHHCKTIHGAYPNNSGRDRLAHAIHYIQSGVKRNDGGSFDDTDTYPLLCGNIMVSAG